MDRKSYYITWFKSGDSTNKFYAPIPKMKLNVIKVVRPRIIVLGSVAYVNREGLSIPFEITTLNPPYQQVVVNITIVGSPTTVQLNQTLVSVTKGVYLMRYHITNIDTAYSGASLTLNFALSTTSGIDAPSFTFNPGSASLTIPVNPRDDVPASFETLSVSQNSRGKVQIYVRSNKLAYLYCVTGYRYMPDPEYEDVKDRKLGQKYSYSKPIYTEAWTKIPVSNGRFENTFWIEGLTPGTEYTTYCYTMNLNKVPSTSFVSVSYTNKPPQKIATFTMKV